ncbi:uncharacterized protein LOC127867851 [Dreissena polymorpha]|nr:uncharacterized protein LOC127867851 [Dreissena polymorpha]
MQPRENKTDSVERRWERQVIGSCLETDYCSSQIRDDISKRTAMSTETASDMGNGSDSAIGHAWPTQVLATEQSDAAKSQMYIDTCDCEFCVHSSHANTLRYNKLFLSNGEGQDLEDRFSYEYSCGELGDNAYAWEDDCYQNDCDENNIEELTRLNLDNIADDTETDITDSDTECNLSFKVGPLVSSMFSNEDHLYGYSDHGNEGDIDSTDDDDERDVYMDAMETSYV